MPPLVREDPGQLDQRLSVLLERIGVRVGVGGDVNDGRRATILIAPHPGLGRRTGVGGSRRDDFDGGDIVFSPPQESKGGRNGCRPSAPPLFLARLGIVSASYRL